MMEVRGVDGRWADGLMRCAAGVMEECPVGVLGLKKMKRPTLRQGRFGRGRVVKPKC